MREQSARIPPTPTMTIADRDKVGHDWLARTDIHLHAIRHGLHETSLDPQDSGAAASLLAIHDSLATPCMRTQEYPAGGWIVALEGHYRGVYTRAQYLFEVPAEVALIRSMPQPSRALLLALVGDQGTETEQVTETTGATR